MRQFTLEELAIAPGRVVRWRPQLRETASTERVRETSFNQDKHHSSIKGSRQSADPIASWLAVTFEIEGELDLPALEAALLHLVRRHEVLLCEFERLAGDLSCAVHAAEDVELERTELGSFTTRPELLRFLGEEFRRGIDTLAWPLYMAGAVVHADGHATAYLAFDHIISDGISMLYVIDDVQRAYAAFSRGEEPHLAETTGYLDFAQEQRARYVEIDAADERLDHWRGFVARGEDFFPRFALDIGVEPGRTYPVTSDSGVLLDAAELALLEARCQDAGGKLFMALLAALAIALHEEGGPETYCGLMPVSERGRGSHHNAVGWFVNTLPIEFPVTADLDFAEQIGAVREAFAAMTRNAEVPFVRAWELLAPEHFELHSWPYPVNFFSFIDTRKFPGSEHHPRWKPALHVWASNSNGTNSWFVRDAAGLHFNSLYADTPTARAVMNGVQRALSATLRSMVSESALAGAPA